MCKQEKYLTRGILHALTRDAIRYIMYNGMIDFHSIGPKMWYYHDRVFLDLNRQMLKSL